MEPELLVIVVGQLVALLVIVAGGSARFGRLEEGLSNLHRRFQHVEEAVTARCDTIEVQQRRDGEVVTTLRIAVAKVEERLGLKLTTEVKRVDP